MTSSSDQRDTTNQPLKGSAEGADSIASEPVDGHDTDDDAGDSGSAAPQSGEVSPDHAEAVSVTPGTAFVIHPEVRRAGSGLRTSEARLEEAEGLAAAIDLNVTLSRIVKVSKVAPSTLLGGGAVEDLGQKIRALGPEIVIVDHDLMPIQQRNLERAWNTKVIDRTGLILEIFGERARTREGMLQVELAHLSYQRSRLVRSWTHLERQRGGAGFMGGPGERQIELDRRQIDNRIVRLRLELDEVRRTRSLHRKARERVPYPVIAFVGYTNAGKSTLFNRLTNSDVFAKDLLFATLDPTMRQIDLGGGHKAIVSDTVGFVSNLPTQLVAAFRATLEEVDAADIIIHVRDGAHPDSEAQRRDVNDVLLSMGIDGDSDPRVIEVLNKSDLMSADAGDALATGMAASNRRVAVSALTGAGVEDLLALIRKSLDSTRLTLRVKVPGAAGHIAAWLYRNTEIVDRQDDDAGLAFTVRLDPKDLERFKKSFGAEVEITG